MPRPHRPCNVVPVSFVEVVFGFAEPTGDAAVRGITGDSRVVQPGDIYCAMPGANVHGAKFAAAAVAAGAAAVLTDAAGAEQLRDTGVTVPYAVAESPREAMAHAAARVYGDPAAELTTFGITGTNGKTTTTYLIDWTLRQLGRSTGLVGTVETRVADDAWASVRTTPESYDLHALLARMRERGVTHCSLEVSSHAIALHRVSGLRLNVAGFTNLSQDHLDFHPTMDDYFSVKAQLFTPQRSDKAVIWREGPWSERLIDEATTPIVTVGEKENNEWRVHDVSADATGAIFTLTHTRSGESYQVRCPLAGVFNVANTALGLLMLHEAGFALSDTIPAMASCPGVPGRMERVSDDAAGPLGVVDYAHTPEALEAACHALRPMTAGTLAVVFGAGGDRDTTKRAEMGAAAARGADVVIVTDDNPRSEDPADIRRAVLAGAQRVTEPAPDGSPCAEVLEVADRSAAIVEAVSRAGQAGGTILIAGKGHEVGQDVAGVKHPFDDRTELAKALRNAGFAARGDKS